MRISFLENRLAYKTPPEGPKPPEDKPKTQPAESGEEGRQERRALADKPAAELQKAPSEAETRNKNLKEKAKNYYEELLKAETPEKIEELRQKAESDDVTLIDLQGGDWIKLSEAEQEKRFAILSKLYLDKKTDASGQEVFVVNKALDRNHKIKMGIGAGHLLPPSIQIVEITDLNGNSRTGTRKIEDNRIGYFDNSGYIPIFGGYTLKPIDFIDEKSAPYKQALEAEKTKYKELKEANEAYNEGMSTTPGNILRYKGKREHPITNLKTLRKANSEELKPKLSAPEIEKVETAKTDLKRIDALLHHFQIYIDPASEIDGGNYLLSLNGKGAEMLGWNKSVEEKQNQLIAAPNPPENVEEWALTESIKNLEKNATVKLIKTLQTGGTYADYSFKHGYTFDITHLDSLNEIANNPTTLQKTLQKLSPNKEKIDPKNFIKELFGNNIPEGMTYEQAEAYILKHRSRLGYLLGDTGHLPLSHFMELARKTKPIKGIKYRWDSLKQQPIYNLNRGDRTCAWTVSTMLGLGADSVNTKGKISTVRSLAAAIIRANIEKTGNPGIVIGFENYEKGDVLVFKGYKDYAYKRYSHVAIVRFKLDLPVYNDQGQRIGTEKYLGIVDEGKHLQGNIVPVKPRSPYIRQIRKLLANPARREEYFRKHPELADLKSLYEERKFVHVSQNTWMGDAMQGGDIAFGVRTSALAEEPRIAEK